MLETLKTEAWPTLSVQSFRDLLMDNPSLRELIINSVYINHPFAITPRYRPVTIMPELRRLWIGGTDDLIISLLVALHAPSLELLHINGGESLASARSIFPMLCVREDKVSVFPTLVETVLKNNAASKPVVGVEAFTGQELLIDARGDGRNAPPCLLVHMRLCTDATSSEAISLPDDALHPALVELETYQAYDECVDRYVPWVKLFPNTTAIGIKHDEALEPRHAKRFIGLLEDLAVPGSDGGWTLPRLRHIVAGNVLPIKGIVQTDNVVYKIIQRVVDERNRSHRRVSGEPERLWVVGMGGRDFRFVPSKIQSLETVAPVKLSPSRNVSCDTTALAVNKPSGSRRLIYYSILVSILSLLMLTLH